jgi:hypothetical protein
MWLAALALAVALLGVLAQGALAETFTVTNTQDSGNGSLRQAILGANGRMGADTIRFRIDGKGVKTIRPESPLPPITTDALTIDGYTQPGAERNTRANGNGPLGNSVDGVSINSANNTVGGTVSEAANVISANREEGVRLVGAGATGNRIQGNFIGTNAAGSTGLGNTSDGVLVIGGASGNTIGGTEGGSGNVITGSLAAGVVVSGSGTIGNRIHSNRIFGNGGLGIDLDGSGVTANDGDNPLTPTIVETDADTGANNLQNFPTVSNVSRNAGTLTASGTLNSTPRQTFTIQCFLTGRSPDDSRHGEGRTLVDETNVITSGEGEANFTCSNAALGILARGQMVTATATNTATGDTSEFSANVRVP